MKVTFIIVAAIFLTCCEPPQKYQYTIKTPDRRIIWCNGYNIDNGCVLILDGDNRDEIICGNVVIFKN